MKLKTRVLIILIILGIIDSLIPLPIIGLLLIFIMLHKPVWFKDIISDIYLK